MNGGWERIDIVGKEIKFYRNGTLTSKEKLSSLSFFTKGMDNLEITLVSPKEKKE